MHPDNSSNQYEDSGVPKKPLSVVLVMVCIYLFLIIERPWESIHSLEGIPVELPFAIFMIAVAFMSGKFKIVSSPTNKWVYGLLAIHFILAPFAFNVDNAVDQGVEYSKMIVLYMLMLSVADDEDSLKKLIKVYVFSMLFYMLHSLWEYHCGRHVWRMGISRMVGVDQRWNDPNAFGASIVLSLPFVYALLRTEIKGLYRKAYYLYFCLAVVCVVLTGSRSAFIAFMCLLFLWVFAQQGGRRVKMLVAVLLSVCVLWNSMPLEKQERIRTLWDEEAGPENAHASAEGRLIGWKVSWRMFKREPFTGVGAGGKNFAGYRMANQIDDKGEESATQSHVLYGQVLAEQGIFGALLFLGLVVSIARSAFVSRRRMAQNAEKIHFIYLLGGAILISLLLILVLGFGGHNFYRPLWLWLAAWSGSLLTITNQIKLESELT
jgi:hypothetical protein